MLILKILINIFYAIIIYLIIMFAYNKIERINLDKMVFQDSSAKVEKTIKDMVYYMGKNKINNIYIDYYGYLRINNAYILKWDSINKVLKTNCKYVTFDSIDKNDLRKIIYLFNILRNNNINTVYKNKVIGKYEFCYKEDVVNRTELIEDSRCIIYLYDENFLKKDIGESDYRLIERKGNLILISPDANKINKNLDNY
jgi:hypothetical protein